MGTFSVRDPTIGFIGEVSLDSFLASEIVLDLADFMMQERPQDAGFNCRCFSVMV